MTDMIEQAAQTLHQNSYIQAAVTVIALISAIYYIVKFVLLVGRKAWASVSPSLDTRVRKWAEDSRDRTELGKKDHIFLIAELARKFVIIIMFTTLYFISLYSNANQEDIELPYYWVVFSELSTRIFSLLAAFNAGSLFQWSGMIARARLQEFRVNRQQNL